MSDIDIFDLLEAGANAAVAEKTPEEKFIDWFMKGNNTKADMNSAYIRSLISFTQFVTDEDKWVLQKRYDSINGPVNKTADKKDVARIVLKHVILSLYRESYDLHFGPQGKSPLPIEKCIDVLMEQPIIQTITYTR